MPILYPDFYHAALREAGKPVSQENVVALAEFTAWNLALNAHRWFGIIGDQQAQTQFQKRFDSSNYDTYEIARLARVPDDMIHFLWAWNRRVHPGLLQFVDSMRNTIARKLPQYGDELPMNMMDMEEYGASEPVIAADPAVGTEVPKAAGTGDSVIIAGMEGTIRGFFSSGGRAGEATDKHGNVVEVTNDGFIILEVDSGKTSYSFMDGKAVRIQGTPNIEHVDILGDLLWKVR